MVLVGPVERVDENLDGMADLEAKLIGHFLLVRGALGQHGFQGLVVGHAKEPPHAQQAAERPLGKRLFQPEVGVPRGEAGRLAARGIDEHPVFAVGHEAQADIGAVQQFHHPGGRRCLPVPPGDRPIQVLLRRSRSGSSGGACRDWARRRDCGPGNRAAGFRHARKWWP